MTKIQAKVANAEFLAEGAEDLVRDTYADFLKTILVMLTRTPQTHHDQCPKSVDLRICGCPEGWPREEP